MSTTLRITPAPSDEEGAAIAAAVQALLQANRHVHANQCPAAYRSVWRQTAIREAVHRMAETPRNR